MGAGLSGVGDVESHIDHWLERTPAGVLVFGTLGSKVLLEVGKGTHHGWFVVVVVGGDYDSIEQRQQAIEMVND